MQSPARYLSVHEILSNTLKTAKS